VPTDIIGQWHYNVGCTSLPKTLMDESIKPIKIFLSYAHRDDEYRQELMVQLSSLLNRKLVEIWHDRQILAGSDWATDINQNLESADIILFLVSAIEETSATPNSKTPTSVVAQLPCASVARL
jgi:TIR domain